MTIFKLNFQKRSFEIRKFYFRLVFAVFIYIQNIKIIFLYNFFIFLKLDFIYFFFFMLLQVFSFYFNNVKDKRRKIGLKF